MSMPPPPPNLPPWLGKLPRFGEQLRDYRTLRGMTVEQLATTAGIAPNALRDIESGKRSAPPRDIVKALADALQLERTDRSTLLEAAERDSPVLQALFGQPAPQRPTRPTLNAAILVFLFADVRGYTRFTQQHGDEAAARLVARFAELARGAVEQWDGQVIELRGDEALAVFASAQQAVRAANELQSRYAAEREAQPELPLGIGIGLDVGEAVVVEEGYRGAVLNRAARLCSVAGPGEVLVSPGVVYIAPRVEGVTYLARGQEQLKGFDDPLPVLLAAPQDPVDAVDATPPAMRDAADDDDPPAAE